MSQTREIGTFNFTVRGAAEGISVPVRRLLIAGYTGRDRAAVQEHIDELAAIGVPPPPNAPMFYEVPTHLLTAESSVVVADGHTSGEVEPVLVRAAEGLYLTIGSDHTDRDLEKRDIPASKASAPKPVGRSAISLKQAEDAWDEIAMTCRVDGLTYQHSRLDALLSPSALLGELAAVGDRLEVGTVMFCGTLPLLTGTFVFGEQYTLELLLPNGFTVSHSYHVVIAGS